MGEFEPNGPQKRGPGPARAFAALLYGFGVWTVLVLGMAGRACTATYSLSTGFIWWQVYTVFGFVYRVPIVAIAGGLAYAVARWTALGTRPILLGIAALTILAAIFAAAALLTPPNGRCVYL